MARVDGLLAAVDRSAELDISRRQNTPSEALPNTQMSFSKQTPELIEKKETPRKPNPAGTRQYPVKNRKNPAERGIHAKPDP